MEIVKLTSPNDLAQYDAWVSTHPHGTLWQSTAWKKYQEALSRETRIYAMKEGENFVCTALVSIDKTKGGLSVWECPRGPLAAESISQGDRKKFLASIVEEATKEKCMQLFFSPAGDWAIGRASTRHIYPEATRLIDLRLSESDLLKQMKPKGRYNINVATKHGVTVWPSEDAKTFAELITETAKRDGFSAPPLSHFKIFLRDLPGSFLLLAFDTQNQPIAGLMGVIWGKTGIYYYGASKYEARSLMAPYLLQWEAMKLCNGHGCVSYDLLGIAPADAAKGHPWAGISEFKEKFGGNAVPCPNERVITLKPFATKLLKMKRKIFG